MMPTNGKMHDGTRTVQCGVNERNSRERESAALAREQLSYEREEKQQTLHDGKNPSVKK